MSTQHSSKGFTLTELLATLAITSILTATAVPSMASLTDKIKVDTSIQNLADAMKHSRSEAVTRNTAVSICPRTGNSCSESGDWTQGWLIFQDSDRDGLLDEGEVLIFENAAIKGDITISQASASSSLSWLPDGTSQHSSTFTICSEHAADSLKLNLSGRVQRYNLENSACNENA